MRSDFSLYTRTDSVMSGTHDSARPGVCEVTTSTPLGHVYSIVYSTSYVIIVCCVIVKLQNGGDRRGAGSVFILLAAEARLPQLVV